MIDGVKTSHPTVAVGRGFDENLVKLVTDQKSLIVIFRISVIVAGNWNINKGEAPRHTRWGRFYTRFERVSWADSAALKYYWYINDIKWLII